jgi:hypothetical protein
MWETINAASGRPDFYGSDVDHGWSSGAAPALTGYVLGVLPTSPGFATFTVTPHPSGLDAADGDVPTPHGDVQVYWQSSGGVAQASVTAPPGTTWTNAPAGAPIDTGAPSIGGSLRSGTVLTADPGTWAGTGTVTYTYQWARCASNGLGCAAIAGETAATYTVADGDGDGNGTIRVFVTGTIGGASSSATALIGLPPPDPGDGGGGGGGGAAPTAPIAPVPATLSLPPAPALLPVEKFTPPTVGAPALPARFRLVLRVTGRGKILPAAGRYRRGVRLTLTARPAQGWRFVRWSGRWCSGTRRTCRLTMTQGKDVKAVFARRQPARRTRS